MKGGSAMRQDLWMVGSWLLVSAMASSVEGAEAGASSEPMAPSSIAQTAQQQYDFGNLTSETLTRKAWEALNSGDHGAIGAYTNKCISLYEAKALAQAASLTDFAPKDQAAGYWALNDVATSYFIRGQSLLAQGRAQEAEAAFKTVIERFPYAQAWDPQGWYWKVAQGAQDKLNIAGTNVDFGNYTSSTLATKAWEALGQGDHRAVELYTKKCIDLYEAQATQQQAGLNAFASAEDAPKLWALNDVATSYFIRGQSLLAQGKIQDAQQAFQAVIEQFPFAQAWDPQGWFWHVADAASDKLSTIGTPYDFGDYKSETLVRKAWGALDKSDHRGVELYVKKCIELYEADAKRQQASLGGFPLKEKVFEYWALNDVATCYFVLGESLIAQKRYQEARATFERVINDFDFAQAWDPKGWFWKIAVGARDRLNKILALSSN